MTQYSSPEPILVPLQPKSKLVNALARLYLYLDLHETDSFAYKEFYNLIRRWWLEDP